MYKLVIVDDETQTRDALSSYFPWAQLDFEIIGKFDNGKNAIDFLAHTHSDVVLTDVVMPIMSGIELSKELYQMKHPGKIIFLSGFSDFEYARKGMLYGVRNYILKPTKYEEIVSVFKAIKLELEQESLNGLPMSDIQNDIGYRQRIINAVKEYVKKNYTEASLEKAGNLVHMNSSYLSLIFKQTTGQNFSDFLMEVKMKKASVLLKDINLRVNDVSERLGYTNPNNFARAFKQFYGIGPMDFRFKN